MASAARTESRRMLSAVSGQDANATVRLSVAQFRTLAWLIDGLANENEAGCGGGCMGAPIDGVRFWVPAEQLAQARALAAVHEEAARQATAELDRHTPLASFNW